MVKLIKWAVQEQCLELRFDVKFTSIQLQLLHSSKQLVEHQKWLVEGIQFQFPLPKDVIKLHLSETVQLPVLLLVQSARLQQAQVEDTPVGFMLGTEKAHLPINPLIANQTNNSPLANETLSPELLERGLTQLLLGQGSQLTTVPNVRTNLCELKNENVFAEWKRK
jgi:hypothetical protein